MCQKSIYFVILLLTLHQIWYQCQIYKLMTSENDLISKYVNQTVYSVLLDEIYADTVIVTGGGWIIRGGD